MSGCLLVVKGVWHFLSRLSTCHSTPAENDGKSHSIISGCQVFKQYRYGIDLYLSSSMDYMPGVVSEIHVDLRFDIEDCDTVVRELQLSTERRQITVVL